MNRSHRRLWRGWRVSRGRQRCRRFLYVKLNLINHIMTRSMEFMVDQPSSKPIATNPIPISTPSPSSSKARPTAARTKPMSRIAPSRCISSAPTASSRPFSPRTTRSTTPSAPNWPGSTGSPASPTARFCSPASPTCTCTPRSGRRPAPRSTNRSNAGSGATRSLRRPASPTLRTPTAPIAISSRPRSPAALPASCTMTPSTVPPPSTWRMSAPNSVSAASSAKS